MCTELDSAKEGSGDKDLEAGEGGGESEYAQADDKEERMDMVLCASGADPRPKADVRGWKDL